MTRPRRIRGPRNAARGGPASSNTRAVEVSEDVDDIGGCVKPKKILFQVGGCDDR